MKSSFSIPPHWKPYVRLAVRGVAIYLIWFLLYELWLLPDGRLDSWLSMGQVAVSGSMFRLFGIDVFYDSRVIGLAGLSGIEVLNGCNGLKAIGLFLGFVWAFPGDNRRRMYFSLFGITALLFANVFRIGFLVFAQKLTVSTFDLLHNVASQQIFYLLIFGLWVLWVHWGTAREPELT